LEWWNVGDETSISLFHHSRLSSDFAVAIDAMNEEQTFRSEDNAFCL
jgi:hypothetical protein